MKALLLKLVKCLVAVNLLMASPVFVTPSTVFATETTDEMISDDQYTQEDQGDVVEDSEPVYDDENMGEEGAEE